jgi:cobalt-precorrin 5A hydrolase
VKTAIITLSEQGARVARALSAKLGQAEIFLHSAVAPAPGAKRFTRVADLTRRLFAQRRQLVYIAPAGVVVRAIAPCLGHKLSDPAVVVVDVGGRWAVSLLSGHEGGANALAAAVAKALSAEPVVTTTTEAAKDLIIGIGCRRGEKAEQIVAAIRQALRSVRARLDRVRWLASASLKADEAGLRQAADGLGLGLRFVPADEILSTAKRFQHSHFVAARVGLPAVAEPAALLAGRRTRLVLPKTVFNGVTVAIAQENCSSSASVPAVGKTAPGGPSRRSARAPSWSATRRTSI